MPSSKTAARRTWRPVGGVPVGTFGIGGAFSFYPTKNLGALRRRWRGDSPTIRAVAKRVRRLRNGGQTSRYVHVEAGINSRLDEMQAAVLRARLPLLERWTRRRRELAAQYRRLLPDRRHGRSRNAIPVTCITCFPCARRRRDALQAAMTAAGDRNVDSLPCATQRTTGICARTGRTSVRSPRAPRASCCRCRCTRVLPTVMSDVSLPPCDNLDRRDVLA